MVFDIFCWYRVVRSRKHHQQNLHDAINVSGLEENPKGNKKIFFGNAASTTLQLHKEWYCVGGKNISRCLKTKTIHTVIIFFNLLSWYIK